MDREKLAEAVGLLERSFTHELIDPVIAAARRLLEAEEVWWCPHHGSSGSSSHCDFAFGAQIPSKYCRMVPRLLADPEETG